MVLIRDTWPIVRQKVFISFHSFLDNLLIIWKFVNLIKIAIAVCTNFCALSYRKKSVKLATQPRISEWNIEKTCEIHHETAVFLMNTRQRVWIFFDSWYWSQPSIAHFCIWYIRVTHKGWDFRDDFTKCLSSYISGFLQVINQ